MEGILTFLVGWFLVSIPSSLAIGALLARRSKPAQVPLQVQTSRARYAAIRETSEMRVL